MKCVIDLDFIDFDAEKTVAASIDSLVILRRTLKNCKIVDEHYPGYHFYERQMESIKDQQEYISKYYIGELPWPPPILPNWYMN